jgi:hypothetical protein
MMLMNVSARYNTPFPFVIPETAGSNNNVPIDSQGTFYEEATQYKEE